MEGTWEGLSHDLTQRLKTSLLLSFPSSPTYKASHQIPAAPSGKRNAKNVNAFPGAGPNR